MKILYLDCGMGAAGDMLTAALLELLPKREEFLEKMNTLIPEVEIRALPAEKCGITGTRVEVKIRGEEEESHDSAECSHGEEAAHVHLHTHAHACGHAHPHEHTHEHLGSEVRRGTAHSHACPHYHAHRHIGEAGKHSHDHSHGCGGEQSHTHMSLHDIRTIINGFDLPEKVRSDAIAVYELLAAAEAKVHGRPVGEIHFHEVGMYDAIADITAVCLLIYELAPDKIFASPIHVGSGLVRCAHGTLPVPAPAALELLRGVPIYGGTIRGELCTPTGAALLKHFADGFTPLPQIKTEAIGYGMGKKDFPSANCIRAVIGEGK